MVSDICKKPNAGRGKTLSGAKNGLGQHMRKHHGDSHFNAIKVMYLLGEFFEASGVSIR